MIVAMGRVRPRPSSMNSDSDPRKCGNVVFEISPVYIVIDGDVMGDAGWSTRTRGRGKSWCVSWDIAA